MSARPHSCETHPGSACVACLVESVAEAERDTRPIISVAGMSAEERRVALTTLPPLCISLGGLTANELGAHLSMVSDYNMARKRDSD